MVERWKWLRWQLGLVVVGAGSMPSSHDIDEELEEREEGAVV